VLWELEIRKLYQIEISNRCAALENLNDSEDRHRAWRNTDGNIKISAKDSLCQYQHRQYKTLFDKEHPQFLIKGSTLKCSGYRIQTTKVT
jgi:hypothetical protein